MKAKVTTKQATIHLGILDAVPPECDAHPTSREAESYYAFEGKALRKLRARAARLRIKLSDFIG